MPSPFPGMDPFIEGQRWEDFHLRMIAAISDTLIPMLRPNYIAVAEERVYLEHDIDGQSHIRPDITIVDQGNIPLRGDAAKGTAVVSSPMIVRLPMPEEVIEHFLTIRRPGQKDVVTVIELLSPTNKRPSSDGRKQYLKKRAEVLGSRSHLVEIDLVRGGQRMPADPKLAGSDYYAIVSRRSKRNYSECWYWNLRQPLPKLPIPLDESDPDVELNLRIAFENVYERAGYDYSLDYKYPVTPRLSEHDSKWVADSLAIWQCR